MQPKVTRALTTLQAKLDAGLSQAWIAKQLDISGPAVSAWVNGRTRPDAHYRKALEILLGIPEDDWMTAEEVAVIERTRFLAPTGTEG